MNIQDFEKVFKMFDDYYELEYSINTSNIKEKKYLDFEEVEKEKYCRFCNQDSSNVEFRTDAHVIPRLLGSKYLLSNFECDTCNTTFKRYENDLANFIGLLRPLVGIYGKSKRPKHKDRGLRISEKENKKLEIISPNVFNQLEKGEREIIIKGDLGSFAPINVYKSLVKIALCFIRNEELKYFERTFGFLQDNNHKTTYSEKSSFKIMKIFSPGPSKIDKPKVEIWKRKDKQILCPEKVFIIYLRNLIYQVPIPLNKKDAHLFGKEIILPMKRVYLNPEEIKRYGMFQVNYLDLSRIEVVKKSQQEIGVKLSHVQRHVKYRTEIHGK